MARFYADENFPLPVGEAGKANQQYSDAAVLLDAAGLGRCVLTLNRKHFRRLHEDDASHAGIILCTFDPDYPGQALRIDNAVGDLSSLEGQLIRVNRPAPPSAPTW